MANLELRDTSRATRAFLLINVVAGKEDSVASGSLKLEQVREAHVVPVDYDLVAVIEVDRVLPSPSLTESEATMG